MDTTTQMLVNQIKGRGYWRKGQTLGVGGWGEVYKFAEGWKVYVLHSGMLEVDRVTAQDDATAVKAFGEIYRLEEFEEGYEIFERITETRTIASSQ